MKKEDYKVNKGAAASGGMGFIKWLLPILIFLGIGWFLFAKGCSGVDTTLPKVKMPEVPEVPSVSNVIEKAKTAVVGSFGKVNDAAMGMLKDIKFASGSAGAQMMEFIKSDKGDEGRFRFKNLNFASGKSTIAGESGTEVDNLSAILKAYEDIKVQVEGFTDSRGNAASNQALSLKRAEAVRARLVAAGIPNNRISTIGFGAASPVATNDTAEGRAQNRRIEVTIVK